MLVKADRLNHNLLLKDSYSWNTLEEKRTSREPKKDKKSLEP